MDLGGGWARYLPVGAENLIPAATRALMIEIFVVETRLIFCASQIDVRPSFVQASQAFSASDGLIRGGLGGEDERLSAKGLGLRGELETAPSGLFFGELAIGRPLGPTGVQSNCIHSACGLSPGLSCWPPG